MALTVAQWGDIIILDEELIDLTFEVGLRLAKLTTVYEQPIIQYVGKDVTRLSFQVKTTDPDKMFDFLVQRLDLTATTQAFTLGEIDYGNFYLESTKIETVQYEVLRNDALSILPDSILATYIINIEAVSENYPII